MKKTLLLFVLAGICCIPALSQPTPGEISRAPLKLQTAERIRRHDLGHKENTIFITLATGYSNHIMLSTWKVEYSRQIKRNFYWGTALSANFGLGSMVDYDRDGPYVKGYEAEKNIYKLDGMLFYRAPVIGSRLFFRVGAGAGVGYTQFLEGPKDKVLPYINLEAAWILRCSRAFEMKFAPTIQFLPSQVAISPVKIDYIRPVIIDLGFSITCGYRF